MIHTVGCVMKEEKYCVVTSVPGFFIYNAVV